MAEEDGQCGKVWMSVIKLMYVNAYDKMWTGMTKCEHLWMSSSMINWTLVTKCERLWWNVNACDKTWSSIWVWCKFKCKDIIDLISIPVCIADTAIDASNHVHQYTIVHSCSRNVVRVCDIRTKHPWCMATKLFKCTHVHIVIQAFIPLKVEIGCEMWSS